MLTLLFRCEASSSLGFGHLMRCFALAQEWTRRGGRAVFAMTAAPAELSGRLRSSGIVIERIAAEVGGLADAADTARLVKDWRAGWVVVDGPMFGAEWERALPGACRLMRIDDNGLDRPFRADLLLNQNLGAAATDYPQRPESCRCLSGPDFALLRPEFLAVGEQTRGSRILVTMGGSDPAESTERVLAALVEPDARAVEADIVVGPGNSRREGLLAAAVGLAPRVATFVAPDNLPARFAKAAFVVTAGGTTLYELSLLRVPMLVLCTAENQRKTCESFAAAGAVRYLGWHADVGPAEIAAAVVAMADDDQLRSQLAAAAGRLVDGLGPVRVAEILQSQPR